MESAENSSEDDAMEDETTVRIQTPPEPLFDPHKDTDWQKMVRFLNLGLGFMPSIVTFSLQCRLAAEFLCDGVTVSDRSRLSSTFSSRSPCCNHHITYAANEHMRPPIDYLHPYCHFAQNEVVSWTSHAV